MLKKSTELNISMIQPYGKKLKTVSYIFICLVVLCMGAVPTLLVPATIIAAICTVIIAGIFIGIFRQVFHQSLFGEDAGTYMQFPISSRDMILGKLLTVLFTMLWYVISFSMIWTSLYLCWKDSWIGIAVWDINIVECIFDDMNAIGEAVFHRSFSSVTAAFLIGSSLVQIVITCILLCSGVQLGTILNHVYNRGGRKRYMPVLLMAAGLIIAAGCAYLPTKIFCILSSDMITVLPIVITMVLEIGLIIAAVGWSIRLLQTKYELN